LGLKKYNLAKGKFEWNLDGNFYRVILFDAQLLKVISSIYDNEGHIENSVLLPKLHSIFLLDILKVFSESQKTLEDKNVFITDCWNEVNAVNNGTIIKESNLPINPSLVVLSSPHIFVNNPFYKNPFVDCLSPKHYECIDLTKIDENFIQRTNFKLISTHFDSSFESQSQKEWFHSFKLAISKMIDPGTERTLQASIVPPFSTHSNSVISISFKNEDDLLCTCGTFSSLIFDFFIKSTGRTNLYDKTLKSIPFLEFSPLVKQTLILRTLRLNCLTSNYKALWENNYSIKFKDDKWAFNDCRISLNLDLSSDWKYTTPLRNYYERRICQIEIDVIVAINIGLTLEGLVNLYETQFPTLYQNEEDTWYDTEGNIVFTTNSQGLKGVGVDRPVWDSIRHLQAGETFVHTITKSELYQGKEITYYAPFDKCDRVEDYKVAWSWFEGVFNN
jgi:hypothetical protein